ncbi:MAG: TolC family protein [Bacteroidales bacterium]|nr:TolC family protein [Bacteroidales bacterium]
MKTRHLLILSILLICSHASFSQNRQLTLDSCLLLAKQNNADICISRLDIEKARAVKAQVFTKFFPQVSASFMAYHAYNPIIKITPEDIQNTELRESILEAIEDLDIPNDVTEINLMERGLSLGANVVQPIFVGGRIVNGNRLANLGIEASELQAEATQRDILEDIESTFLLVTGLESKVNTVESALYLLDSLHQTVEIAMQAGVITSNDLIRVELKQNEIRASQLQLSNGIVLAKRLLCQQIGIPYNENIELVPELVTDNDIPITISKSSRPEHRLLELNIDAQKLRKRMTIGEALPQIILGGMGNHGNLIKNYKYNTNGLLFVTANVPLSQWWETSHKIKEHNISIRQAEIMRDDLNEKMKLQEQQAYNQMVEASALIATDKKALEMAMENYRLAELNYKAGTVTLTDVLEANTLLLQAENTLTDRQITFATARRRYKDLTNSSTDNKD